MQTRHPLVVTTQRLIRIPCRLAQLAAHVPLLAAAAALTWLRNQPVLWPMGGEP